MKWLHIVKIGGFLPVRQYFLINRLKWYADRTLKKSYPFRETGVRAQGSLATGSSNDHISCGGRQVYMV